MNPLTDELNQTIIHEHPDGLWLVLGEDYPQDRITPSDLLGEEGHVVP
jgi:hypothetical protein